RHNGVIPLTQPPAQLATVVALVPVQCAGPRQARAYAHLARRLTWSVWGPGHLFVAKRPPLGAQRPIGPSPEPIKSDLQERDVGCDRTH
ncbi:MAG: hypothetical protein ACREX8_02395, partial [Gammaproteobacteria bacterium]